MSKKVSDLLTSDKRGWWQDTVVANAPLIVAVFANFVVIVSDIRAFDVVYQWTGVWWKALFASLACAVPFLMWEIAWQYNHTTDSWRTTSLFMAGFAFITSIVLSVADYITVGANDAKANFFLTGMVIATGLHTVVGFLYYYNDPDVARDRRKAQALGTMMDMELNTEVTKTLLENGETVLKFIEGLKASHDPEDVERILNMLQGKKQSKPTQKRMQFSRGFAQTVEQPENPTQGRGK